MIKDALKQIFTYGVGSVAQSALNFALLPLYLRFFEPSQYGVISLLLAAISLLTVFANVGIVSGLFRLYDEAVTLGMKHEPCHEIGEWLKILILDGVTTNSSLMLSDGVCGMTAGLRLLAPVVHAGDEMLIVAKK